MVALRHISVALAATLALAPHESTAAVETLTSLESQVVDDPHNSWVVGFSLPANEELDKLAAGLAGTGIRVGAMQQHAKHAGVKLFGPDKRKPILLASPGAKLSAASLGAKALEEIKRSVSQRLGQPKEERKQQQQQQQQQQKQRRKVTGPLELTDGNFDEQVIKSDDAFIVAFVAPWCGHCKALAPEFQQAAVQLADSGVVAATVDATANERLAQRYGIQGFPTIKFFPPGALNKDSPEDYQMERSAAAIVQWSLAEFERRGGRVTVEIPELTSQAVFDDLCEEDGKCIVVFLPDLLDTGAEGRKELITQIEDAQREARHIRFGWVAAAAQPALEETYHLSFGFPAVLYLRKHAGKELGMVMRGTTLGSLATFASSPKGLGEFAEAGWPAISDTPAWDGEEAPEPLVDEDDDFDLDSFLNDDD